MDTKKIGIFLKDLRNEKGMTQEQLGEKIGVSNKTISRWETGKYMPPVDCLNMLSDIYNISINEILGGERASGDKFTKIADENITVTLKGGEKNYQTFKKIMMCILALTTVLTIIIIMLLPMNTVRDVIVMVLVIAVAFIANTLNLTLNLIALATKEGISSGIYIID
ncbi:MAG: helix-turn-helix transcriptional regulator [Lachnospiraceae bacterium]|nr:helix-turn-helix transcriptional regulator [Lachnospiraceae bacterium]